MNQNAPRYIASIDAAVDVARQLRSQRARKVFLVFDVRARVRVAAIARHLRSEGFDVAGEIGVRAGERIKTPEFVTKLQCSLIATGADRASVMLAIGGGTLTDAAGFAAATYMRGMPWLPVATTVLCMADAAIGGKTGVDLANAKNLIGAFWQPVATVADLLAIDTLPLKHRRAGMAEIVKAAVVGDARLMKACERFDIRAPAPAWLPLIRRAAAVKRRLVARDPLDRGERAKLNLGHTVGHAIESASRYAIAHGEAVAVGLRAAGLLSLLRGLWAMGDHTRMLRALAHSQLPLHAPIAASDAAFAAVRADKKRTHGMARFVLPTSIGSAIYGVEVVDREIRRVMRACSRPPREDELPA